MALATGVSLPYVERGDPSGVPLILLHGPTDSWRSFELMLAHLPAHLRTFAVTQRGHGNADRPADGYRPEDFAGDVVAFMDALGIEAAVLAGHSGAGFTAQRVAVAHPDRTLGIVLIAAPHTLHDKPLFRDLLATVAELTDPIDADFVREFAQSTVTQPVPPAFLETVIAEACKVPARIWQATLAGLLEGEVSTRRERPGVPALLLWGDRDEICPRGDQEALSAGMPGAELMTYEGAGHSPHWEQPERSAADIAAFAQLAGRAAALDEAPAQ